MQDIFIYMRNFLDINERNGISSFFSMHKFFIAQTKTFDALVRELNVFKISQMFPRNSFDWTL